MATDKPARIWLGSPERSMVRKPTSGTCRMLLTMELSTPTARAATM